MLTQNSYLYTSDVPTVAALGCFDGVHLGHRAVISEAKKCADALGAALAVFTFEAPVRNYIEPRSVPVITSVEEKLSLLEELGADVAVCAPLEPSLIAMEPRDFVEKILIGHLNARHIVCGYNYTFGKGAKGTPELIRSICLPLGIGVTVVPELKLNGTTVSSSLIRRFIANGDAEKAACLLGRPYGFSATVISGQQLARKLGFPTVNVAPPTEILLPKNGVYLSEIRLNGTKKYGITNIGVRPTVATRTLYAETHVFDFNDEIYGQEIKLGFLHFLRAEKKFASTDELAEQVHKDIHRAQELIKSI